MIITAQEARDAAKKIRFSQAFKVAELISDHIQRQAEFGSVHLPVLDIIVYPLIKDDLINIFKTNGFDVQEVELYDGEVYLKISWKK